MWVMFYIHRYIRLTGVYAIIIGLHSTLLKFMAGGPQSHQVQALVDKCRIAGWMNFLYINNFAQDVYGPGIGDCINVSWYMAIDMQFFIITPIILSLIWKSPKIGYTLVGVLFTTGTACQIAFTIVDDEFFHGGFSFYIKPWNRSQPYLIGLLLGIFLHKKRNEPSLKMNSIALTWFWSLAVVAAAAVVYGPSEYNITKDIRVATPCSGMHPPMINRVMYNGFAKVAWSLAISWVILACVKGKGGIVNSILCWPIWIPLARVQYCLYLLHRTVIYLINSRAETTVRYSNIILTQQFLSILAISTGVAFLFVVLFEAPIVHMEKLFFGSVLGIGKKSKASTREKHNNDDAKKDITNGDNVNNNNDDMEKDNESGDTLAKIK